MKKVTQPSLFSLCFAFVFCISASSTTSLYAGPTVEFESTFVRVEVTAEQDSIPVDFKFKVKGNAPLKISNLEVGCKCLQASVERTEYQPGESGVIKTVIDVGAFEGEVSKFLTMVSNDSISPQLALKAVVVVPSLVIIDPPVTTWTMGDAPIPKKIIVKVVAKDPVQLLKISSTRNNFLVESRVITPGREYEISVTPRTTEAACLGLLSLETDCKIPKYSKRQAFCNIVRRPPSPAIPR